MYRWPICDHVYNEPIGLLCPECQWESTREDNGLGDSACGGGVAPELTNIMNSGVPDGNCLGLPTAYDMGHSRTQFHNSGNSFGPTRDKIMVTVSVPAEQQNPCNRAEQPVDHGNTFAGDAA
jgi:hypothetical protein